MLSAIFLVSLISLSLLVLSAPTSFDSSTLLQNGQAAQQLNAEFFNLKVTDSCNTGDTACISGLTAQCTNGAWQTQKCPGGTRECFALPSVKNNGTFIACTSEANALSLIGATGVQGGLASNTTSTDGGDSANGSGAVTLTIVLTPGSTASLPPTTATINPADASSLVSNLSAGGTGSTVSIATSSVPSSSASTPSGNASQSPILLTDSPVSPTSTTSASNTTSASSTPTTSSADSSY
ncbi:hypothetical protein PILCRDRAFT_816873 [Piloderma croceum F 1598]|uniref:Carbohydrate-binding module family 19 domain-containing protein n=1 Tax=Piloderma croceum (strain F 1598) TaxID=765440 RepID=A0A0C3C7N6_PILCF|nr:hypothetical protein PILCRDRAFT_816873 [Piloderma croceum F 1598]